MPVSLQPFSHLLPSKATLGLTFLLSYLFVPHKEALAIGIFLKPLLALAMLPSKDQGVCEGGWG